MKRSILILTIACILLSVSGCQKGGDSSAESGDTTGMGTVSQEENQKPASRAAKVSLKTEGETVVMDKNGIVLDQTEGMYLCNGSRVVTADSGYAWFGLGEDSIKLDRLSAAEVNQKESNVLLLETGRIFFDIPSAAQRLSIRTAPAGVTITEEVSGYVEADGGSRTRLCVLSGSLVFGGYEPVTGTKKSVMVSAGQTAVCELFPDGSDRVVITISDFESEDVPVFAAEEVAGSASLKERIDSTEGALSASAIVEGLKERRQKEEVVLASRVQNASNRQANWEKEDTGASDEMFWNISYVTAGHGAPSGRGTVVPVVVLGQTGQMNQGSEISIQGSGSAGSSTDRPAILVYTAYEDFEIETPKDALKVKKKCGNVTVKESVGEDTVTLKDIHIYGNLLIQGGGSHSVKVDGCTLEGAVIVDKSKGDPVHLELLGKTTAPILTITEKNKGTVTVTVENSSLTSVNAGADVEIVTRNAAEPEVTLAVSSDGKTPSVKVNDVAVIPKLPQTEDGHQFDEGKIISPTCSKQGYTIYTCQGCPECTKAGKLFSYIADFKPISNIHNYAIEVQPPTDEKMGYTEYTCQDCGYSYRDEKSYTDFDPNYKP